MEKIFEMLASLKLNRKQVRNLLVLAGVAFIIYIGYGLYINHANKKWVEHHLKNPNVKSIEINKDKVLIKKFAPDEKL